MQRHQHEAPGRRNAQGHYLPPAQLHQGNPHTLTQHQQQQKNHGAPGGHFQAGHYTAAQAAAAVLAAPVAKKAAHLADTTFASLPLSPASQRALSETLGFTHLTEVQDATLPAVRWGAAGSCRRRPLHFPPPSLILLLARLCLCGLSALIKCCLVPYPCKLPVPAALPAAPPSCVPTLLALPAAPPRQVLDGGDVMARAKTGTGKTMVCNAADWSAVGAGCSPRMLLQLGAPSPCVPAVLLPSAPSPTPPPSSPQAFLIPSIEALVRSPVKPGGGISVLVLSPTRELASQASQGGAGGRVP